MSVNVFVNEARLSTGKYENFLAKGQAGLSEEEVGKILKENRRNLPCRKLFGYATEQIKRQILEGNQSGTIEKEGFHLHWMMEGDLEGLTPEEKEKAVSAALDGSAEDSSISADASAPKGWSPDHQKFNGVKVYVPCANDMYRLADRTWKKRENLPAVIRIFNPDGSYRAYDLDLGMTAQEIVDLCEFTKLDQLLLQKAGEFFESVI